MIRGRTVIRRLCAVLALLATLLLPGLAPAYAEPSKDPNLRQTVRPDEQFAAGRVELSRGHVDIGPRIAPVEAWKLQARDDTQTPPKWRDVNEVLVRVRDTAILELPNDPQYGFLGIPGGAKVHVVPQTQNQDVVWLGWNTQDPAVTERVERGAKLVLHRVQGPGTFNVFLQNGFDPPQPLWTGGGPDGQEIWVDTNTHTHANWVFGKPGVYLVDFSVTATGRDGRQYADRRTLRFAVGDQVTAQEAWAASLPPVSAPPATAPPVPAAPAPDPFNSVLIIVLVAAGVISTLAVVAIVHTVRSGIARSRVLAEEDEDD